jgi:hypothetical protein
MKCLAALHAALEDRFINQNPRYLFHDTITLIESCFDAFPKNPINHLNTRL